METLIFLPTVSLFELLSINFSMNWPVSLGREFLWAKVT